MIILRERLYSEAGEKKLEERARKKANKRLYQIQQGREATPGFHGTPVDWLENKSNKEVLDILEKSSKPDKSRKHLFGSPGKSYELSDSQIEKYNAELTLRAGRRSLDHQRSGRSNIAKLNKQPVDELMENINIDRKSHPHGLRYTDRFEKELEARKDRLKKIEEEKAKEIAKAARKAKIRKAAPWVIGGTLATAGTIAGVKALKKKKTNKKDNK